MTTEQNRDAVYDLWREGYGEHYVRPKDAWDAGWRYGREQALRELKQAEREE